MSVTLQDAILDGASVLSDSSVGNSGQTITQVHMVQQSRGFTERSKSVNYVWRFLTAPVDTLATFGDECGGLISCPVIEICETCRETMIAEGQRMRSASKWRALFHGQRVRMAKPDGRITPHYKNNDDPIWIATDATLEWIRDVSRYGKQVFRARVVGRIAMIRNRPCDPIWVAECEPLESVFDIS